jgi:O-antigen/teichoic acid export membrane protein
MKETVKRLIKHPLIYGSAIIVFGNLFANFFNFLYNLFMSRNLTVEDYGTLASIVSLISLPILLSNAITPMVIKFAGDYFATKNMSLLRGFYLKIKKFYFIVCFIVVATFLLFIGQISHFFHITDINILYITALIIIVAFMGGLNIAFLQAKLAFGFQVFVSLVNAVSKLVLGAFFVLAGYGVPGATLSILLGGIFSYLVSFIPLRFIFDRKIVAPKIETKSLFSYGIPSAMASFGLTSFIAADMILVKHFFDPVHAGLYAGLSLIGRVIFYISGPIGSVMFPVIVQKHSKNESFVNTFRLSLFLVFAPSVMLTLIYYFFPDFVILFFLKKEEYLAVKPLLWLFGAYICLYSLVFIMTTFYLSIKKTKVYIPVLSGAFAQIVLIILFHQSFLQIIMISLVIMFLLVIMLLLYYPYATKK